MRFSSVIVIAFAAVACRDVPQAPNTPPPEPPPFTVLRVDHVDPLSDCCGLIAEPNLFVDGDGSVHLLYGAWDVGAVRYAGCPANCWQRSSWHVGEVDSSYYGIGDGGQVAAGLSSTALQVVYQSALANGFTALLTYAWCPGACYLKRSWQAGVIDTMAPVLSRPGGASAIADSAGGVQAVYAAGVNGDRYWKVRYAECLSACGTPGAWQRVTLDSAVDAATAIARGPDGRTHVVYYDTTLSVLRYAACASACGSRANWLRVSVATMTPPSYWYGFAAHLRVGADGRLHALAHLDSLTYLTCAASCDSGASWQRVAFDSLVGPGALALGPDGSVFVVAGRRGGGAVLARCDTGCAVRTAWHWTVIDFTLQVLDAAIASAPDGKPVIALTTPFDVYVALMR